MSPRAVPEWVGKTPDTPVPDRVYDRVWERCNGHCKQCTRAIRPGDLHHVDHIKALANGGQNRESNLQILCGWCHQGKTREDVAVKAKNYQRRKRHRGIKKRSSFQTNRGGKFKQRIDGTVVRRT